MKKFIKLLLMVLTISLGTGCYETSSLENSISFLSKEELQTVGVISDRFNTLLKQKETLNFMKSYGKQFDKRSLMIDYLTPNFKGDELNVAIKLIEQLTMIHVDKKANEEGSYFEPSPAVAQLSQELTNQVSNTIALASAENQSPDQLKISLQSIFANFKATIYETSALTFDEARGLIAFAEFEENSIGDTVDLVLSEEALSSRTKGWFSKLVQIVVTAVVATVVVVAAVATGGVAALAFGVSISGWIGTAVLAGAIVGSVYGIAVGYDMAVNHNSYFTDFDPSNIAGGFLEWEHCFGNPGYWACI